MPPGTTASSDLDILLADGTTWLPLTIAPEYDDDGNPKAKTLSEVLAASDLDTPISKRLVPVVQESFIRGAGLDYQAAPGSYTRSGGFACPAGAVTEVEVTTAGASLSRVAQIEEYDGDLFFAQVGSGAINTGRVMRSPSGTGALSSDLALPAGEYVRDLITFDNGSGTTVLWASSSDVGSLAAGTTGRMHSWNGATWNSPSGAPNVTIGRNALAKAYWVTPDGIGAWRMMSITGPNTIAYTLPNSDPHLASSWVEGVRVSSMGLFRLAFGRRHVWMGGGDGLFDLDEQGNTPSLTSYTGRMLHPYNGLAVHYHENYVYMSLGQGLDRVYVGEEGTLQENPGLCSPTWGTEAEHAYGGFTSALTSDQGYIVNATYNLNTQRAAVWWGKDRNTVGIDSPNPLIWYGPELVSTTDLVVFSMRTTALGGGLRLWMAATPYNLAGSPWVGYVSIPIAGSPLQDMLSATSVHRFSLGSGSGTWNANSQIDLMPSTLEDTVAKKIVHQHGIASRGLGDGNGTKIVLQTRADPTPGQTTYTTTNDITVSPAQSVTPASVLSGNKIGRLISLVSPNGQATPVKVAVLDACRMTAWRVAPTLGVRTITVIYGDGAGDLAGGAGKNAMFSPDWITDQLIDLTESARTTLRDRQNQRWTVKLEQVVDRTETLGEGEYGKTVEAKLEITVISEAA